MTKLLFLLLLPSFMLVHEFEMTNFEVSKQADILHLRVKMDKEDLESIYTQKSASETDLTKKYAAISEYLNEHFVLVVNNQKINFKLKDLSTSGDFYDLSLISPTIPIPIIQHIKLTNTCLLESSLKHANIVSFDLNEKYRTFRLHKDRTSIEVAY